MSICKISGIIDCGNSVGLKVSGEQLLEALENVRAAEGNFPLYDGLEIYAILVSNGLSHKEAVKGMWDAIKEHKVLSFDAPSDFEEVDLT